MGLFRAIAGMGPLEAYEALVRFARKRGEMALRLAMHAAVPQAFRPDLLHLIKRNFVPEAADDPAVEADVLLSSLCEDLGGHYFQFDPEVQRLLLDNLALAYAHEPTLRVQRVANLLLWYAERYERGARSGQNRLLKEYLEMQRWLETLLEGADSAGD